MSEFFHEHARSYSPEENVGADFVRTLDPQAIEASLEYAFGKVLESDETEQTKIDLLAEIQAEGVRYGLEPDLVADIYIKAFEALNVKRGDHQVIEEILTEEESK